MYAETRTDEEAHSRQSTVPKGLEAGRNPDAFVELEGAL